MQKLTSFLSTWILCVLIAIPCFAVPQHPFEDDEQTIALWHFDDAMPEIDDPVNLVEYNCREISTVCQTRDGSVYLAGFIDRENIGEDYRTPFLMKLNSEYEVIWDKRRIEGDEIEQYYDITELENGTLVGVTLGWNEVTDFFMQVFHIINQNGELIDIGEVRDDEVEELIVGKTMRVFCTSEGELIFTYSAVHHSKITKYSSDLNMLWMRRHEDTIYNLKPCGDNLMLFLSVCKPGDQFSKYFVGEIMDMDGETVWTSDTLGVEDGMCYMDDYEITDNGYLFVGHKSILHEFGYVLANSWINYLNEDLELVERHWAYNRERRTWPQQLDRLPGNKYMRTGTWGFNRQHHHVFTMHLMDERGNVLDSLEYELPNTSAFNPRCHL